VSGVKRLAGGLAGHYRLRTGDYRLQFFVQETKRKIAEKKMVRGKELLVERQFTDHVVVVDKIGHRDGFYEE
jgi:hypothetical protein